MKIVIEMHELQKAGEKMQRVVYGEDGFSLSGVAKNRINVRKRAEGKRLIHSAYDVKRDDPDLIAVLEERQGVIGWQDTVMQIAYIPDDYFYTIMRPDNLHEVVLCSKTRIVEWTDNEVHDAMLKDLNKDDKTVRPLQKGEFRPTNRTRARLSLDEMSRSLKLLVKKQLIDVPAGNYFLHFVALSGNESKHYVDKSTFQLVIAECQRQSDYIILNWVG